MTSCRLKGLDFQFETHHFVLNIRGHLIPAYWQKSVGAGVYSSYLCAFGGSDDRNRDD